MLMKQMKNIKAIYRSTIKDFYFDCKDFIPTPNKELQHITYLRQALFDFDFLNYGNFFDLPCSVLYFSLGEEMPTEIKFPVWCRKRIMECPGSAAVYNEETLVQTIQTFIDRSMKSKLQRYYDNAKAEYESKKDGIRKKQLADVEIMNGNYLAAYKLLDELKNSKEQGLTEMMPSILLTYICMSIATGEISSDILDYCIMLIDSSRTYEQKLLAVLVHYWLALRVGKPFPDELELFLQGEFPLKQIVKPFILEQIIAFHSKKRMAYEFLQIADMHRENEMIEHSLRCLLWSFNLLKDSNTNVAKCYLLHTIAQSLFRVKYDFEPFTAKFASLLESSSVERAPITATYFALMNPKDKYKCGFIKVSIISMKCENAATGPIGFDGDWPSTAQRLFGFAFTNSFFSIKSLKTNQFSVGDQIEFKLSVHNNCSDFPAGTASLLIEGNAESTSAQCEFDDVITLTLTIKGEGEILVRGVQFLWCEKITIFTEFKVPASFIVPEGSPRVSFTVTKPIYECVAGTLSTMKVDFICETPIDNFSLITSPHLLLISPRINEIGGQYQIKNVAKGTISLTFLFSSPNVGVTREYILASYSSESNVIGFKHVDQEITVFESISKKLPFFPTFMNQETKVFAHPPFNASFSLEGTTLMMKLEANEKKITSIFVAFDGFVVGKSKFFCKELLKGNSSVFSVDVFSFNNLIISVSCNGVCYAADLSKYMSLMFF